ncbi:MAG TPA: hypothetical protein VI756_18620 [Blastocatellia bacterium]
MAFSAASLVVLGLTLPFHGLCSDRPACTQAAEAPTMPQLASAVERAGPATLGLRILIEAQSEPFDRGQPIEIVFHTINVSTSTISVGWSDWHQSYSLQVVDPRGHPVDEAGIHGFSGSVASVPVGPGQEFVEAGNLSEYYALPPGTYRVTARRSVGLPEGTAEVLYAVSNTISITVAAPDRRSSVFPDLSLSFRGRAEFVYQSDSAAVVEVAELTNVSDHEVTVAWGSAQPWFHDLLLDVRTLAGEPVPPKVGAEGKSLSAEDDRATAGDTPLSFSGALTPGQTLKRTIHLYQLYPLRPGTTYSVRARLRLRTPAGSANLASKPDIFSIALPRR